MWRLTRAHERPTRGQRNEDRRKKEREKERVARGGREEDVCVRTRARIGDEDESNATEEKKGTCCVTQTHIRVQVWVYSVERSECVYDCDGECVQRSVSSCRAWSGRERRAVSAPHPESPSKPTPPTVTNPHPITPASLFPRLQPIPSSIHRCLSLAHFSLHAVLQPLCAGTTRRRKNGKNARRRDTMQISIGWYVRKLDYFTFKDIYLCTFPLVY